MKFPDQLSEFRPRCVCGRDIVVRHWHENQTDSEIVVLGVHGREYAQRIDRCELHERYDSLYVIRDVIRNAERALGKECPTRQVSKFGEVITAHCPGYPDAEFRSVQSWASQQVSTPATLAKPTAINPTFGKPIARRIVK